MPRARGTKQFMMTENKGWITDQSSIKAVENSCIDELNMQFSTDLASRERRPGLNKETNGTFLQPISTPSNIEARRSYFWEAAGGEGSLAFHVIQLGQYIYFMQDRDAPISLGLKTFYVDLDSIKESYATTTDVQNTEVDFSDGNGVLFIASNFMNPQYVTYDPALDNITVNEITIRVRDLEGLDDGLATDERPVTLSDEHKYNLYNQGWQQLRKRKSDNIKVNAVTEFNTVNSEYPSNADVSHLGVVDNGTGDLRFDAASILDLTFGNTPAPKGHFIIDPFNIDYEGLKNGTTSGGGQFGHGFSREGSSGASQGGPAFIIPQDPIDIVIP